MKRAFLNLAVVAVVVGLVLADVAQTGTSQVQSTYSETFYFPLGPTAGSFLNTMDTTNHWMLSFNQQKGISISLSVTETGSAYNNCILEGYLIELANGTTYEFRSYVEDIPVTWLRAVPDVKWVNIQNVFIPVTTGNLPFNLTINYADFWTNAQAFVDAGKSAGPVQSSNCTREAFSFTEGGFLQSKPFWIEVQLITGQRLTFPVSSGYYCRYARDMGIVRFAC